MRHTVLWRCRGPAGPVEWPPLYPLTPTPADRNDQSIHLIILLVWLYSISVFVPPVALLEGCERPKTEARGELSPEAEAQLDPRMGPYLWVMQLPWALLLSDRGGEGEQYLLPFLKVYKMFNFQV